MRTFAIVGSGWRAKFYIKVASVCRDSYRITKVLCRSEEKALLIKNEYEVATTLSEDEIIADNPDFIVVAVTKTSMAKVSKHWRDLGFVVLCETPAGMNKGELLEVYNSCKAEPPLIVAEQYPYYPTYENIAKVVNSGKLGDIVALNISLAHEYHGAALMYLFLQEDVDALLRVCAKKYELPVTKTKDRYHVYTDGEVIRKTRCVASVEFENGKLAFYDFDSEQYRSPIRHNSVKITGTRGELINEKLWYLDDENNPREELIQNDIQRVRNTSGLEELSEDETAILALMDMTYKVSIAYKEPQSEENQKILEWANKQICLSLQEAYFMLLLEESNGEWIESENMPWMEDWK